MIQKEFTPRQIEIMEAATQRIDEHGIQNLTIKTLAADIELSEPALYRHFAGKNEILLGLLEYFKIEMKNRVENVALKETENEGDQLRAIFRSQLETFAQKPAIVSVIFAESIFHFDKSLSNKVSEIIAFMEETVHENIKEGQRKKQYSGFINSGTMTTIITGGMRMAVMKWKLSGNKSSVVKSGMKVLNGILKMMEK